MFPARITLPPFSVSAAMWLPKIDGRASADATEANGIAGFISLLPPRFGFVQRAGRMLYCADTQRRREIQSFRTSRRVSAMYRPARELSRDMCSQIPTPNDFLNKDRLAFDCCTCLVTLIKMSVGGKYGGI